MHIIVLSPDQLQSYFDGMVKRVESCIKDSQKQQVASKEWLTAKDVCALLKISHTTLHDWSRKGILKKNKIGNRIRYRHDEVLESLTKIESKNRMK
ncbi:MAG: helix-turn-helix domain-containing protein [Saprospiraceae bacterium]|nr:helix-turn-helix domain-containing protein [Candidatus Vicinibacter affinis]MBK7694746.1 helix-turn-helix domain-containing protein [Candidatus Vicinibacter affinis]MBK9640471.1 helix-turn-helix domain-containing protein [Candidatus Vicinibacter affinis]